MESINIHPGEHLADELKEMGMSAAELARQIQVPTNRVTQNPEWTATVNHRGHGAASCLLLWDERGVLAEPPKAL